MPGADVTLIAPYPPRGQVHAGHSGVASYSANLAAALVEEGARVRVLASVEPGEPRTTRGDGVTVHRVFRRGPAALVDAARAATRLPGRIVHLQHELFLHGGPTALPGLPVAVERLRRQRRLVVTLHQVVDPDHVDRDYTRMHRVRVPPTVARVGVDRLQRYLAARSHRTIVHERTFADLVAGAQVVPHGIEQSTPSDRTSARRRLGLDDRLTVLCFGFVAPYKGLETALAAADLAGEGVQLVIAGGDHPRLPEGHASALARRHPGVARFTGHVPDDEVGPWHAAADVALFCYPRPHASSGAVALALAHGTPMLLGDPLARCLGAPDELSVPLDPMVIAERLRALAVDTTARDRLRLATAELSRGRSWPRVARRHLDLYEELLRDPNPAHRSNGSRRPG